MSSKFVARFVVVNIAAGVLIHSITGCFSSPPPEHEQYITQARHAQDAERLDEARVLAERVLEQGRRTTEAREILAEVTRHRAEEMRQQGDYHGAYQAYLDSADYELSRPQRGQDLMDAMAMGQKAGVAIETRLEIANQALNDLPHDRDLRRSIARLAEDSGDDSLAVAHYLWLFSADDSDIQSGLRLGIIYLALDRPADSAAILRQVYSQQPENVQAALNLANAYAELRHNDDAEELFETLLERFPQHPAILRNYADFEERRGEIERARQLRDRAQQASPSIEERDMRPLR